MGGGCWRGVGVRVRGVINEWMDTWLAGTQEERREERLDIWTERKMDEWIE